jgi:hypothetical protein
MCNPCAGVFTIRLFGGLSLEDVSVFLGAEARQSMSKGFIDSISLPIPSDLRSKFAGCAVFAVENLRLRESVGPTKIFSLIFVTSAGVFTSTLCGGALRKRLRSRPHPGDQ